MVDGGGKGQVPFSFSPVTPEAAFPLSQLHALLFLKSTWIYPSKDLIISSSPPLRNGRPNTTQPSPYPATLSELSSTVTVLKSWIIQFSLPQFTAQTLVARWYSINTCLVNKWKMFEQERLTRCAQRGRFCPIRKTEGYSLFEYLAFFFNNFYFSNTVGIQFYAFDISFRCST